MPVHSTEKAPTVGLLDNGEKALTEDAQKCCVRKGFLVATSGDELVYVTQLHSGCIERRKGMEEEFSCAESDGKDGTILRLLIWPSANYTSASIFETRERKCFWRSTDRVHIVPSQETEMKDMLGIVSSSEMLNAWDNLRDEIELHGTFDNATVPHFNNNSFVDDLKKLNDIGWIPKSRLCNAHFCRKECWQSPGRGRSLLFQIYATKMLSACFEHGKSVIEHQISFWCTWLWIVVTDPWSWC